MLTRKRILALVLVAAVIGSAVIYDTPRAKWRADLWMSKISGNLPGSTWVDLSAATLPHSMGMRLGFTALQTMAATRGEGPCPVLWETRIGPFWGRDSDCDALHVALMNLLVERVYFPESALVRPGDVVIDGGSHLGTFTRYALNRNARLVVAFEPEMTSAAGFRKTFIREISEGKVVLWEEALWNAPGRLSFSDENSSVNDRVVQSDRSGLSRLKVTDVPATTVDLAVQQLNLFRVDFIKLNIEGSEAQALAGAHQTLGRFKPRILVALDHHPDDPEVVSKIISESAPGYRVILRGRDQGLFYQK